MCERNGAISKTFFFRFLRALLLALILFLLTAKVFLSQLSFSGRRSRNQSLVRRTHKGPI